MGGALIILHGKILLNSNFWSGTARPLEECRCPDPRSSAVTVNRHRLPARYQLRLYPDLTHNKICQYQVPNWDQAFA